MKEYTFENCNGSVSLLELLREEGAAVSAECGGRGTCGKCIVYLNEEQVRACSVFPRGKIKVTVPETQKVIVAEGLSPETEKNGSEKNFRHADYAVCVDLGTTTIAGALVDINTKSVISQTTGVNSQRIYGADVITRLEACENGRRDELKNAVHSDLDKIKRELLKDTAAENMDVPVYIAGNTVMTHIFAGMETAGLARAPYSPADTGFISTDGCILLPAVSAFVGGDVLIGMIASGAFDTEEVTVFIDIGTNGEMAAGNRDKIYAAGTAAGPALEGGRISCGGPARIGAVSAVDMAGRLVDVKTIGNGRPECICGSGIIEGVYELLKNGIIDVNGNMSDEYGGVFRLCQNVDITQDDIRQVQLAKGAVRAGLETLLDVSGFSSSDVKKVYVAGGFGRNMNIRKACGIGLINPEFADRTVLPGNTSLLGAVKYACGDITDRMIEDMKEKISVINLADSDKFSEAFIRCMNF